MRLYIIRHGETVWNTKRRLQGQTDTQLNENGRELARITAQALRDVPFDLAFTSPLQRAAETAEIILGGRNVPIIKEERIREISFGVFEGKCILPDAHEIEDPDFHYFFDAPEKYCPPGEGESLDSLIRRTGSFLDELKGKKEFADKTVLISTHGAASRALLANITGCPRSSFWGKGVPKNCSVSIIRLLDGRWIIEKKDEVFY